MHDFLLPLPSPAEMNAWDREATGAYGIPEFTLMENAAREAVDAMEDAFGLENKRILIIMGGGNNGGDGAAMARRLHDRGLAVLVCHRAELSVMHGAAAEHCRLAEKCGVRFSRIAVRNGLLHFSQEADAVFARQADIVVDALLGTGLHGQVRNDDLALIRFINSLGLKARVLAVDVPSGLDGLSGIPSPDAVRADVTVTFQAPKPGLVLPGTADFTGKVVVRSVGIPARCMAALPPRCRLIRPQPGSRPLPCRDTHKTSNGRVLVVGGSSEYTGAPTLSALAALRTGTGMVSVACPASLAPVIRTSWPEIMVVSLGQGVEWQPEMSDQIGEVADDKTTLVIGPGMGRSAGAKAVVESLLGQAARPAAVIDADALHVLADSPDLLQSLNPEDILTPHPGEAAALLGTSTEAVQKDRSASLEALVERTPATVILKGAGTLVGRAGSPIALSPFSLPVLSVGGSGDVLSGVCASLLARSGDGYASACLAVHLHGRAGEILERDHPWQGVLARQIADAVAQADY